VWSIPLFVAWWIFASYDSRFILLILPILCVMAGVWLSQLATALPVGRWVVPIALIVTALGLYTVWNSVEHKDELVRAPFMSDAAKHEIVLSPP
jgi:hypothetical protein